jgi:hypothetical protein
MKLLLELTEKHLDLIKEELKIPEAHYDFLVAHYQPGERREIPAEYEQSVRILKTRSIGLGMSNAKEDCVIKNFVLVPIEMTM